MQDTTNNIDMLEVTPRAIILLKDFFRDKEIKPVRIFVKLGGCGTRSFGVAIEKQKKDDEVIRVEEFTFIIDKKIWDQVKPIKVDADRVFFRISGSGIQPGSGCGTCGYMCGSFGGMRCSGDCLNCKFPCSHGQRVKEALRKKQEISLNN